MSAPIVLRRVMLGKPHRSTGNTRLLRGAEVLPPPSELHIVKYLDIGGFGLLYLDEKGNAQTDTWHKTLEDAMAQADFEFQVKPLDWGTP